MRVQFKQWDCIAQGAYYGNKRKAISLVDAETHEPIATASVNVVASECDKKEVFVKNYSENVGMEQALINADIIKPLAIDYVKSGYVVIGLFSLTDKALNNLWKT